jgi:hypothetical protein
VDYLALQVGQTDDIVIDKPDAANANTGQVQGDGASQSTDTDKENSRCLQSFLPLFSDVWQHKMPGITLSFLRA